MSITELSDISEDDPDALPLADDVALITGSGRGLGRIIAQKFLALGAKVVLHDIDEKAPARFGEVDSLSGLAKSLARDGGEVAAVTGDITNPDDVQRLVASASDKLGPVSVLVNCAGGDIGADGNKPNPATPTDFKLEDVMAVLNRNLIGTMLMCRAVAPGMVKRNRGSIVNIGSIYAHRGVPIEIGYSCAKAAIVHYTRCLATELRDAGVRANVVSPGPTMTARFMATRQTDDLLEQQGPTLVRYATPEEVADAIMFFTRPESRFVSGQVLLVDGGDGPYAA